MINRLLLLSSVVLATGCKSSSEGPAAPVADGSFMTFEVTQSTPSGPITHDLRLSFAKKGEMFEVTMSATGAPMEELPAPFMVNTALVPEANVIAAYDLGRLWLPPNARESGKKTPCGAVGRTQKFREWEVFVVDGLCGTAQGSRYYEKNTGMLVGFMFSGSVDVSGYVKESG